MYDAIQVEPRNLTWLAIIDEPLQYLRVSEANGAQYCDLYMPSPQLAATALWEAVTRYARVHRGSVVAPPLQTQCAPLSPS